MNRLASQVRGPFIYARTHIHALSLCLSLSIAHRGNRRKQSAWDVSFICGVRDSSIIGVHDSLIYMCSWRKQSARDGCLIHLWSSWLINNWSSYLIYLYVQLDTEATGENKALAMDAKIAAFPTFHYYIKSARVAEVIGALTWLIYVCDVTHLCVWRDSFMCVTWLIHVCDVTHSCVW